MPGKFKTSKKYITRFKKLAFGGEEEGEFLSVHAIYDDKGNIVEEHKTDEETGALEKNFYFYDPAGKMIKHELVIDSEGISEIFEYNRDEKGRLLTEIKYYGDDPGEKSIYEYGASDQPVKIERFDSDGEPEAIEKITYNERDLPVEHLKLDPTGKLIEKSIIGYSEQDKPLEKKVYGPDGKLIRETFLQYNEQGELSRIVERNGEGKITSDIHTYYDERGNITERSIRDFHPRVLRFKYDENDNCIEEEMLDENGNLTMRSVYTFDEQNRVVTESGYFMDMNRSHQMANTRARYEYEE